MGAHSLGRSVGSVASIALAALVGVWSLQPPEPPRSEPPADQFSVERALRHVESVAREPHFIGTAAHDQVREYITNQFAAAGVETAEQPTTMVRTGAQEATAVWVHNLAARLRGTAGGQAVALVAHYDSAAVAPGAADDGHGVAVLLESLRALKAGPPFRNDVIFLATDAEEAGLWGARAFVDRHPWRDEVRAVLNLEARGSSGPVWMFRANPESGWLVRALAKTAPFAQASSLGDEVFRFMPNDTDLSAFRRTGYPGLDFAFIGDPAHYHSSLDSATNLDRRSLYQQGANAVALLRYLGNVELNSPARDETVYHGTSKTGVLVYSKRLALPLALVAAVLTIFAAALGLYRRWLTPLGILAGMGVTLLAAAAGFGVAWFAEPRLLRTKGYLYLYHHSLFQLGFLAALAAIAMVIFGWFMRRNRTGNLWFGTMLIWAALGVATSALLPGMSHVFVWPLLPVAAAALVWLKWGDPDFDRLRPLAAIYVLSAPAIVLMVQTVAPLLVSFPEGGSGIGAALVALLAGLLAPHIKLAESWGRWWLPGALCAAGVVLFVVAGTRDFDASHPRPDTLVYAFDSDANQAYWLSSDRVTDGFTSRFLGATPVRAALPEFPPLRGRAMLQAPAPLQPLSPTTLEFLASQPQGDFRILRFRVRPQQAVNVVYAYLDEGTELSGVSVDDAPMAPVPERRGAGDRPALTLGGLPESGAVVQLRLRGGTGPLRVQVVDGDYAFGLPPRPAGFMPHPFSPDLSLVRKTWELQ